MDIVINLFRAFRREVQTVVLGYSYIVMKSLAMTSDLSLDIHKLRLLS